MALPKIFMLWFQCGQCVPDSGNEKVAWCFSFSLLYEEEQTTEMLRNSVSHAGFEQNEYSLGKQFIVLM